MVLKFPSFAKCCEKKITIGNLINRLKKTLKIKTRTSFIYIILLICLILILVFLEQSFHVSWVSAVVEISAGYTADGRIYASCLRIPDHMGLYLQNYSEQGILLLKNYWRKDYIFKDSWTRDYMLKDFWKKGYRRMDYIIKEFCTND